MSGEDAREAAVEEALLKTMRELDDAIKARAQAEVDALLGPAEEQS